jgi:hypothetical protein
MSVRVWGARVSVAQPDLRMAARDSRRYGTLAITMSGFEAWRTSRLLGFVEGPTVVEDGEISRTEVWEEFDAVFSAGT